MIYDHLHHHPDGCLLLAVGDLRHSTQVIQNAGVALDNPMTLDPENYVC